MKNEGEIRNRRVQICINVSKCYFVLRSFMRVDEIEYARDCNKLGRLFTFYDAVERIHVCWNEISLAFLIFLL